MLTGDGSRPTSSGVPRADGDVNGPQTTPVVLDRMARDLVDHLALIDDGRSFTFGQLRSEVRIAAAAMVGLGLEPGDRVAIWSPNTWHWVVSCLAIHYAGAVLVPVNTGYTAGEAADILARVGAPLLIATGALPGLDRVAGLDRTALPALRHIVRVPIDSDDTSWDEFLAGPRAPLSEIDARAAAVHPDDVADIMFTSGTTGHSKGVLCAHRQSLSASLAQADCRDMTSSDRYLCVTPFFHSYGYKDGILASLQTGAVLVPQRTFDPEQVMRVIAQHRITVLPGPPTIFQMLLDHPARPDYDLSSLRIAETGATTLPVELVERIQSELNLDAVVTGYGLTEAAGFGTACRVGDDPATVATTCGRPIADFELRIDNPDESGAGEVLLRGPNVMLGYLDDPQATAEAIDADGWLHTGDIGTVDEAGNLRITDRLKDMFICGGFNVYPAEIELALSRLDGVAEAAVIGVPDDRLGEVGRVFIVTRPDAHLTEQTVIAHLRERLANFKIPRSVVFVAALPRNASGKVLKTALRIVDLPADHRRARGVAPRRLGGPPVGAVENWVADAWQVLLNIDRPGRRDRFTDLGGDSLSATEFCRMLRTQFGVSMSMDRLASRPTIAAVVADLQPGVPEHREPVVRLRDDGSGPVCLMVPGIGGHAWIFTALADALAGPCDVLALSLMDVRDGPVSEMRARIRSAAMEALAPQAFSGRKIMVAGYSFGAMIAADLACWLADRNVPVAELILLDPDPLESRREGWNPGTPFTSGRELFFVPGSPAARHLDGEITAVSRLLQQSFLDDSIRLPRTTVSWVQSRLMANKHQSASTVFGTPIPEIDRTVLELNHFGMVRIPGVSQVARWLDDRLHRDPT